MRTIVAAAIKKDDKVRIVIMGSVSEFKIDNIENSTPRPGKITWRLHDKGETFDIVVNAAEKIEVVELA